MKLWFDAERGKLHGLAELSYSTYVTDGRHPHMHIGVYLRHYKSKTLASCILLTLKQKYRSE
jgi:hypothetical protein